MNIVPSSFKTVTMDIKIGLKLYSTNIGLINAAEKLYHEDVIQYIECYALPGSYISTIRSWRNCCVPLVIHAPHSVHGVNLADANKKRENLIHLKDVQLFADNLGVDIIIIHGGHSGKIDETLHQIALLNDNRFYLENKPPLGLNNKPCVGWSPEEFSQALHSGILAGTVLDFGHAACAAFSLKKEALELVHEFLKFKPRLFHIADSQANSAQDCHLHLGKGNLDIGAFLSVLTPNDMLTLETPRSGPSVLDEFIEDVQFVRDFFQIEGGGG